MPDLRRDNGKLPTAINTIASTCAALSSHLTPTASALRLRVSLDANLALKATSAQALLRPSPGVSASSFFLGAGPHISFRGRGHFEPWVHGLVGVQHFDFGGVNFPGKTTSVAWIAGGGVEYRFNSGFGLRAEVDYLGSHYGGALQRNFQIVAGVVWNF